MEESEEELKNLLMRVNEESEKVGLKLNNQKLRSWHLVPSLHGKRWGKSGRSDKLYRLRLQITVNSDCIHEIRRHSLLGRKVMAKLESILKS